jgi:ubiquitin-conjugating enzyme E2 J2
MATRAAHKRLTREYATLSRSPPEYITAHPSESNILEWHYILTGPPGTPYEHGQYWGTLVFPPDYPFAPPAIRMHTPSGRFRCSERLCLSISDFHPKSFNPAWEVSTILLGVLSFMTSEEMTTGSVSATEAERKAFASRTRWWNSTGGGSTKRTLADQSDEPQARQSGGRTGFGAIKAGDGGLRFKEHWPEEDEENWRWMETERIDPQTGRSLILQQQAQKQKAAAADRPEATATNERRAAVDAAPPSWLSKNKWYIVTAALFAYVLAARALGDQK